MPSYLPNCSRLIISSRLHWIFSLPWDPTGPVLHQASGGPLPPQDPVDFLYPQDTVFTIPLQDLMDSCLPHDLMGLVVPFSPRMYWDSVALFSPRKQ